MKGAALHRAGVLAGLLAGPFFLISVGLNTWASIAYLHRLGWEFVGGEQVPWPSSLARGPHGWAQVATFLITGLLIVILAVAVRNQLPRRRGSSVAVVLLAMLGVALILAAFRVEVLMLTGAVPPRGTTGSCDRISVDHRDGCPCTLDGGSRIAGQPGWRPVEVVSLAVCGSSWGFLVLAVGQGHIPAGDRQAVRLGSQRCRTFQPQRNSSLW